MGFALTITRNQLHYNVKTTPSGQKQICVEADFVARRKNIFL
jgi:hypothetical protein